MRLAHIRLKNYRRFEYFEMHIHPELTVIAARNGQGKTTLLEAIAAALGPFIGAFDNTAKRHPAGRCRCHGRRRLEQLSLQLPL